MTWCWLACQVLLKIVYLLRCRVPGLAVLVFRGELAKDAELLVLGPENAVLRRHAGRVRYEPADRAWFAAPARLVPRGRWTEVFPVTPASLLAWHRKLAAGKYDAGKQRKPGCPPARPGIARLVVRLARENPLWGRLRTHETRCGSCAVHRVGDPACCGHRSGASPVRPDVAAVFQAAGTRILRTAVRAPRMNAICERLVGTLRRELLDRVLILGEGHLCAVLAEYHVHYNTARPHQSIAQRVPDGKHDGGHFTVADLDRGRILRKPVLGALINEYARAA